MGFFFGNRPVVSHSFVGICFLRKKKKGFSVQTKTKKRQEKDAVILEVNINKYNNVYKIPTRFL